MNQHRVRPADRSLPLEPSVVTPVFDLRKSRAAAASCACIWLEHNVAGGNGLALKRNRAGKVMNLVAAATLKEDREKKRDKDWRYRQLHGSVRRSHSLPIDSPPSRLASARYVSISIFWRT